MLGAGPGRVARTGAINGSGQPPVGTKPAHPSHTTLLPPCSAARRAEQGARVVLSGGPRTSPPPAAAVAHASAQKCAGAKGSPAKKGEVWAFCSTSLKTGGRCGGGKAQALLPSCCLAPASSWRHTCSPPLPWGFTCAVCLSVPLPFLLGADDKHHVDHHGAGTFLQVHGTHRGRATAELPPRRAAPLGHHPCSANAKPCELPTAEEGAAIRLGALVSERALGSPSPRSALSALSTCLHSNPPRSSLGLGGIRFPKRAEILKRLSLLILSPQWKLKGCLGTEIIIMSAVQGGGLLPRSCSLVQRGESCWKRGA